LLGEARLHDDADAKEAFKKVLQKTVCTLIAYALVLADFVENQGPFFNTPPPMKDLDLLPHEWWDLIGVGGCTFTPIACRILVQVRSTSSCEWN